MAIINHRFNSISAMVERARQVPERWHTAGHKSPLTYAEVLNRLLFGDERHVPESQCLLDKIEVEVDYDSVRAAWFPSASGAYPSIPDYLHNSPTSMRTRRKVENRNVPIGLWVDVTSSAAVSLEDLKKRGISVLALAMYLQAFRPVELHITISTKTQGSVVLDMDTTPFNISQAADILCNGETARLPMYAIIRHTSDDLLGSIQDDPKELRKAYNIPEGDLVITGTHVLNQLAISDPIAWINSIALHHASGNEIRQ